MQNLHSNMFIHVFIIITSNFKNIFCTTPYLSTTNMRKRPVDSIIVVTVYITTAGRRQQNVHDTYPNNNVYCFIILYYNKILKYNNLIVSC